MRVSKVGTRAGDGSVGTAIDYAFTVTNTGTLTLTDMALSDELPGLGEIVYGIWPGAVGQLAPGQSVSATASYTITQADLDAGEVRNTADVSARTPQGDGVRGDSPESVVSTAPGSPQIDITKTQQLAAGATGRPGDLVEYEFVIRNDGNVTLGGVTLGDSQAGLSDITIVWPGEPGVLLPGQVATGRATRILTQADVDAGGVSSTATTSGRGAGTIVSDTASGEVLVAAAPGIRLEKTAVLETVAQQGAGVRYEMTVENTGNVTLRGVDVTDALAGLSPLTATWPGTPGELAAGESAVFTARYVIGQADVDRGSIVNTASAVGEAPDGTRVDATDENTVPVPRTATIELRMQIAIADGQEGYAGDELEFTYTATNTGTTTLTGVQISDLYPGLSDLDYVWPGEPGVLLPGQTVTATARVTITADMESSVVASQAVVNSVEAVTSAPVADAASATLQLPVPPGQPVPPGVTPAPGTPLPATGGDPTPYAAAALLLLLAGLVVIAAGRRRGQHTS